MTRFLFWLIVLPLAVLMALFGVANSQNIQLDLDPLPIVLTLPLYATVLGAVFIGLLVGGVTTWLGQGRWRRQARMLNRRVRQLERESSASRRAPPVLTNARGGRDAAQGGG
ncbi:MAG: LapA family protein [Proteobacteria bacterium]|nr:LapA family protein [Pseudomonadota bacterium]MDA1132312.1 LapA family protein [Pseudomonadota bacterium]